MARKANEKKSPLKDKPLRNPGQSLDEQIQSILDGKVSEYIFITVVVLAFTLLEWIRWSLKLPYSPVGMTIAAMLVVPYCIFRLIGIKAQLRRLKLGRDGERAVGQYLELLREKGCRVFHDIVAEGFNIDHVVIGEHGVFAIETKTFSKPSKGKAEIKVENEHINVNGRSSSDILTQARAIAGSLQEIIKASTGKDVPVRTAVVFPGWFVHSKNGPKDIWFLNPKALPTYIENTPKTLSREDMMLVSYHISRHIRQAGTQ